jgi:hypothetical protein
VFGLLTDYPHEICHRIQVAYGMPSAQMARTPCPIREQMAALFGGARTGDIRSHARPLLRATFPADSDNDSDGFQLQLTRRHAQVQAERPMPKTCELPGMSAVRLQRASGPSVLYYLQHLSWPP